MISTTTLKNAAFAIEHDLWTDPDGANYLVKDGAILRRWEPEHDDGEALRLAGAISYFNIFSFDNEKLVTCDMSVRAFGATKAFAEYETSDQRMSAIRLAILLCAAKIGAEINRSPENH